MSKGSLVKSVLLDALFELSSRFSFTLVDIVPRRAFGEDGNPWVGETRVASTGLNTKSLENRSKGRRPVDSVNGKSSINSPELVISTEDTIPQTSIGINNGKTRRSQSKIFIDISDSLVEAFRDGLFSHKDLSGSNIGFEFSASIVAYNDGSG